METPLKQMTELEFSRHLNDCIEHAKTQSWLHVIDAAVVAEINDAERRAVEARKLLKQIDAILKPV